MTCTLPMTFTLPQILRCLAQKELVHRCQSWTNLFAAIVPFHPSVSVYP